MQNKTIQETTMKTGTMGTDTTKTGMMGTTGMTGTMDTTKTGMMGTTGMTGMGTTGTMGGMMTGTKIEECAKMCMDTAGMINKTKIYLMTTMKGDKQTMEMLNILTDCKEMLCLASEFMMRGSMCHSITCNCCTQICEKCCSMCDSMYKTDKMMKMCCDMIRQCSQMCRDTSTDTTGTKAQEYKQKVMECCH